MRMVAMHKDRILADQQLPELRHGINALRQVPSAAGVLLRCHVDTSHLKDDVRDCVTQWQMQDLLLKEEG